MDAEALPTCTYRVSLVAATSNAHAWRIAPLNPAPAHWASAEAQSCALISSSNVGTNDVAAASPPGKGLANMLAPAAIDFDGGGAAGWLRGSGVVLA